MKGVFFLPWVGNKYFKNGVEGIKILVLGESHWCKDCGKNCKYLPCPLTKDVSRRFIDFKKDKGEGALWMRTWTRFINIFFGEKASKNEIINFWESIVFYNYVQRPMPKSRTSPTEEDFTNGKTGFESVCKKYNPDLIIVWGKRLWDRKPDTGLEGKKCIIDKKGGCLYFYKNGKKEIPAYRIYHPSSSAYNYKSSTKYLKKVVDIVKNKQTKMYK